ncbi:MAG: ErfK/YbiS/YcfS/YnhG [Xanthobacteraceae bacterium]|nr:ErfK/YbiS/YcfS/YnhG [Xanthobacteraceae bacterium]
MRYGLFSIGLITTILFGAPPTAADAAVLISVDKSTQQMTVSVDGRTRWQWPVSTGRAGFATPSGNFKAFRMEADHYSKEFDEAPMPHSIFFTKTGHAIHGYLDTRNIGRAASHGCVRLEPDNAAKLFALVQAEGVLNTTVVLTGEAARPALVASPKVERRAPPADYDTAYGYERRQVYVPQSDYYVPRSNYPVAVEAYPARQRYPFDRY